MYSIIGSMEHGKLDRAAEKEAGKVARRVASNAAVGMSRGEVQDHISMVSRSQGSTVDITYVGDSRSCADSTRKVTLMTPEPLIDGAVGFLETSEDIYISTKKIPDGITYYVNPYGSIGTTFQRNGKTMKLVPRVVQAHPGTRLVFKKPDNVLTDQFAVYFDDREVATLGTQCGNIQKGVQIKNGSTIQVPLQCTAIVEGAFFLRAVELYKEGKHNQETSMLDREAMNPLFPVFVREDDIEMSINETIQTWNRIAAEDILTLHTDHNKKQNETWWITTSVIGGIALIVVISIIGVISSQVHACKKRRREIPTAPVAERGYSAADINHLATEMEKRLLRIENHSQVEEPLISISDVDEIPLTRSQRFRRQ